MSDHNVIREQLMAFIELLARRWLVIVPREPTAEMARAPGDTGVMAGDYSMSPFESEECYRGMIDAALKE